MRIRTVLAFGLGAAVGAGVTYGPTERRVEARRWALARGRERAVATLSAAAQAARTYSAAAIQGFREAGVEPD